MSVSYIRNHMQIRDCETCRHFKLGWNRERRICGGFPDVPCDGAESDFNLLEIPVLTAANFDDVMASSKLVVALFTQVTLSCYSHRVPVSPSCLDMTVHAPRARACEPSSK